MGTQCIACVQTYNCTAYYKHVKTRKHLYTTMVDARQLSSIPVCVWKESATAFAKQLTYP